jgi:F0F1-type ATP synthase delta subunit
MQEIEKYIYQILDEICKKSELDQVLFDVAEMEERLGYRTVFRGEGGDKAIDRKALVADEVKRISSKILKESFLPLLENEDLRLFEPGIFKIFAEELNQKAKAILFFHLTTAVDLDRQEILDLSSKISHRMGRWVKIDIMHDRSIIGGAMIKKDNYIFDFSLKTKLLKLGAEWKRSIERSKDDDD